MSECRFSIVHYLILKPPPTNSKMVYFSRPRRGQIKQVNCAKIDKEKRSASRPSICKIMASETSNKNCQSHDEVESAYDNQRNEPLLPVYPPKIRLETIKDGTINQLLFNNNKSGPDETCPKQGIIYLQNVQGLSGKDKRLEYLVDPIVDLMVAKGILAYCVQETWIVGNANTVVRNHMIFRHNREEIEVGTGVIVPGGVAIIITPKEVTVWRASGAKPPITTPLQSKFVGRFLGLKLQFPRFDKFDRRVRGELKLFIASIYHPVDNKYHKEFNDTLTMLVNSVPKSSNFIGGHDMNANIGVRKKLYKGVIGPIQ